MTTSTGPVIARPPQAEPLPDLLTRHRRPTGTARRRDTAAPKSSRPPQRVTLNKKLSLSAKQPAFQHRPSSLTDHPPLSPADITPHVTRAGHITRTLLHRGPSHPQPPCQQPPQATTQRHVTDNTIQTPNTATKRPPRAPTTQATLHLKNPQNAPKNPLTQAIRDCRRALTDCDTAHKPLYYAPRKSAQLQTLGNKHLTYGFLSRRNGKLCAVFANRGLWKAAK